MHGFCCRRGKPRHYRVQRRCIRIVGM
jgi:hypothetical protein